MENENKELEQPSPVVIPEESVTPVEAPAPPVVEEPAPVENPVELPAEPTVAETTPVEVTSPEMNKTVEEPPVVPAGEEKKKGPMGKVLAVILVLVLLVGGGYFYLRMTHTGEKFLENSIDTLVKEIKLGFDLVDNVDFNENDYKMTGNAKLTASGEGLDLLNNINVDFNYDMSLKNEYIYLKAKVTQDAVSTDLAATVDGKVIYANLGDLYAKTIKYESEENPFTSLKEELNELSTSTDMDDLEYELEKMLTYSKEALLLSTITTKYEGLKVTYTYVINASNKEKVNNKFAELVKADTKLMELLNNEVPTLVDEDTTLSITTGLLKNDLEALDLVSGEDKVKVTKKDSNNFLVEVTEDGEKYTADVTVKGKEYTAKIKDANGKELGTLVFEDKGNTVHVVYSTKEEGYDISVAVDYTMKSTTSHSMKVSLAAIVEENKVNLDATLDFETKAGLVTKTIPDNTINLEEMGSDLETVESKLMTRLSEYKFYPLLESMMGQDDYDYDYTE